MTTFKYGAPFYGSSMLNLPDSEIPNVALTFSVVTEFASSLPSGTNEITPLMLAEALNDLLVENGWPPAQFWGAPADVHLNDMAS
jgi:hypothetical protein